MRDEGRRAGNRYDAKKRAGAITARAPRMLT